MLLQQSWTGCTIRSMDGSFREPRGRAREYVTGLVAGLERENGWTLAERSGEVSPDGMQRLPRRADWDVDGVRDDARSYLVSHLDGRDAALIADGTAFLKKGVHSAAVQLRRHRADRELPDRGLPGHASRHGHALVDRELQLPESWTADRDRCEVRRRRA